MKPIMMSHVMVVEENEQGGAYLYFSNIRWQQTKT